MTQLLQSVSQHQPPSTFEGGLSTTGGPTAPSEDDESEDDEDSQFGDAPESPHPEGEFPSSPPSRWSYPHPTDIHQREHPEAGGYPDASLYTSASDQSGVAPGWPQPTLWILFVTRPDPLDQEWVLRGRGPCRRSPL